VSTAAVRGRQGTRLPLVVLFGQAVLGLVVGVVWWAFTRHPATWMAFNLIS